MKNIDFHRCFIWVDMMDVIDKLSLSVTCFGTLKIFWPATAGCRALRSFELLTKMVDLRALPSIFVFLLTYLFANLAGFASLDLVSTDPFFQKAYFHCLSFWGFLSCEISFNPQMKILKSGWLFQPGPRQDCSKNLVLFLIIHYTFPWRSPLKLPILAFFDDFE